MNETTTSAELTGLETAISLFEILSILLPLVGVLMQVMIRVYLSENRDLSYRRQISSISFVMVALVVFLLTGGGFLTYIIRQPVASPLTFPLLGFGLGLALVVLAVLWVVGDVLDIIEPPSERGEVSSAQEYPPGADPRLTSKRRTTNNGRDHTDGTIMNDDGTTTNHGVSSDERASSVQDKNYWDGDSR